MVRLSVAVLLAAVVQFVWGFVFWALLPMNKVIMDRAPNDPALTKAVSEALPHSGNYVLPYPDCGCTDEGRKELERRTADGPVVQIVYHKEGVDTASIFGMGFLHVVGASFLGAWLLTKALPGLPTYRSRVTFVFLLGAFAAYTIRMANPIWFHHPWRSSFGLACFDLGAWLLAGLVVAAIIRPAATAAKADAGPQARSAA